MSQPAVSVVLPVYNQEKLLARAIESVFAQTFSDWELIVIDDGSTDRSRQIAESFGSRVQVLTQANSGPYVARNLALSRAQGEFVAFIDSDDIWLPHRLESQLTLIQSKQNVGLVFGDAVMIDYSSSARRKLPHTYFEIMKPARGNVLSSLVDYNFVPQSSVLVRQCCFEKLGGFSLAYPRAADYAKWLQIAMHYEFDFVDKPVMEYAIRDGNFGRGALRDYFGQTILYEELLRSATDPATKRQLQKLIVNSELTLISGAFQDGVERIGRIIFKPASDIAGVPQSTRMFWCLQFFWRTLKAMPRYFLGLFKGSA
jgi:glycosyltransferase involved in cell wall biosynthesis